MKLIAQLLVKSVRLSIGPPTPRSPSNREPPYGALAASLRLTSWSPSPGSIFASGALAASSLFLSACLHCLSRSLARRCSTATAAWPVGLFAYRSTALFEAPRLGRERASRLARRQADGDELLRLGAQLRCHLRHQLLSLRRAVPNLGPPRGAWLGLPAPCSTAWTGLGMVRARAREQLPTAAWSTDRADRRGAAASSWRPCSDVGKLGADQPQPRMAAGVVPRPLLGPYGQFRVSPHQNGSTKPNPECKIVALDEKRPAVVRRVRPAANAAYDAGAGSRPCRPTAVLPPWTGCHPTA